MVFGQLPLRECFSCKVNNRKARTSKMVMKVTGQEYANGKMTQAPVNRACESIEGKDAMLIE